MNGGGLLRERLARLNSEERRFLREALSEPELALSQSCGTLSVTHWCFPVTDVGVISGVGFRPAMLASRPGRIYSGHTASSRRAEFVLAEPLLRGEKLEQA
jgi:hypothetical protein